MGRSGQVLYVSTNAAYKSIPMLALTGKSFKIATINILTELKKSTVT
jgi:hypothetical protein